MTDKKHTINHSHDGIWTNVTDSLVTSTHINTKWKSGINDIMPTIKILKSGIPFHAHHSICTSAGDLINQEVIALAGVLYDRIRQDMVECKVGGGAVDVADYDIECRELEIMINIYTNGKEGMHL